MLVSLIAIAAGVAVIYKREAISARPGLSRVPVLRIVDRLASHPLIITAVGAFWIGLGMFGLIVD